MEWDIRNDQPIYTQLIQQVTLAILSGTFPCGGRLPPVREMAAEAGVNPNTMLPSSTVPNRSWPTSRSEPFCTAWSAWATTGSRPPSWCGLGRRKHKRWLF